MNDYFLNMKLLVVSHKETWHDSASPTGYATIGGFPFQMRALSEIFDETTLLVMERMIGKPEGTQPLVGNNLSVKALPEPRGRDFKRKLFLIPWLIRYLPNIWRMVKQADAVHAPVPGDLGSIGILIALIQKKPLFVRHCGKWGKKETVADRIFLFILERIAGGKNVVLATGGAEKPPSKKNPHIHWIFSTSLNDIEFEELETARYWVYGEPLKLITVGSLKAVKNTAALIKALPKIMDHYLNCYLDLVGSGYLFDDLVGLTRDLGMSDNVTFHGNLSHNEVLEKLASSHIFILPSFFEGFPKALLEAMAVGLPVIASPVSVIPYLIGQPKSGILLESTEPESISQAVRYMISDPETMRTMSKNARTVARQYTLEKWRDQIHRELTAAWGEGLRVPCSSQDKING